VMDLAIEIHEIQRLAQFMGNRLTLKGLVEGTLSGTHRNRKSGASLDFAQHRDYVWGDDLKHLDWKAYAKNDRYVIKQYQEESNLRAFMLVDRSTSMNYQGGGVCKKGVYAAQLAATLSWMFLLQGEAVGAITFGSHIDQFLPARSQREHFWRILDLLKTSPWLKDTHAESALGHITERLPPRGVVFLITDGFDFQNETLEPASDHKKKKKKNKESEYEYLESFSAIARQLQRQGYHVVVLHILDPYELDFPFDQLSLFEGLEGELPIKIDPNGIREAYLQEVQNFCKQFKHKALSGAVSYIRCRTDHSLETSLLSMLEEIGHT
jgi:uncharacterized protein (DUF58 family)